MVGIQVLEVIVIQSIFVPERMIQLNVSFTVLVYIEFSFQLPDCFCSPSGTKIPGGLKPEDVPQMIVMSFDDAVNNNNFDIYKNFFNGQRKV